MPVPSVQSPESGNRLAHRLELFFFPAEDSILEHRFLRGLCLLATIYIFLLIIPLNAMQHLNHFVDLATAAYGLGSLALYLAARKDRYYVKTTFFLLVGLLDVMWFVNGGSQGSIGMYFFMEVAFLVIFFQGGFRVAMLVFVLVNGSTLYVVERVHPGLIIPFAHVTDRYLDLVTGFLLSHLIGALMLWVVVAGFHRERRLLRTAADSLRAAERRQDALLAHSWDTLAILETDGTMLYCSPAANRIQGYSAGELQGFNIFSLIHEDDLERVQEAFRKSIAMPGRPVQIRYRVAHKQGGWVDVESVGVNYLDDPLIRGIVVNSRDVTGRVEVERELRDSRMLLATLIDSTDDLVFSVDSVRFSLVAFNRATRLHMSRHFGVELKVGMLPEEILPPGIAGKWREIFARALQEGSVTLEQGLLPGTDQFTYSFNLLVRGTRVLGIAVFGKDLSPLRHAEEERRKIELQLWQSQKMESLGSLAGGIAHDFNNMLGGIIGYADLLLTSEEDPRRQGHLKAILGAAERSSEMTRKLLAFGRRGKNVVESLVLDTLIREGHEMLKPTLRQGVDVVLDLIPGLRIDADPSQINQVFLNLVINANDAMLDKGIITISTRAESLDAHAVEPLGLVPGEYVSLTVADNGTGMNEETRAKVFDPFFTTKTDGKVLGSGLGLATVYGIVHSHQGAIRVESCLGEGSVFTVYFPKGKLRNPEARKIAPIQNGRGTILIVEDEPVMMKFTQAALHQLGYASLSAWDGLEGSRIYEERHAEISAVILDLKMPKMGGRECFGEMQKVDPQVAVLICTGYGENEEVQDLISRGARGLLKKPFRVNDLSEHLKRILPQE